MTATLFDLEPVRSAVLSPDGRYRYRLDRLVGPSEQTLNFVMVNPSTADHRDDDRTVAKCMGYARTLGFGRLVITNLFGLRSTDPAALARVADPVGPDNDAHLAAVARLADLTICGWGARAKIPKPWRHRPEAVLDLLRDAGATPHALTLIGRGDPGHPLFLRADLKPFPWIRARP